MFYYFTDDGMKPAEEDTVAEGVLTVGYLTVEELSERYGDFGFEKSTVDACKDANTLFRSGVEVHKDYTFTELRIMNAHEEADDYIALYLKKNLIIVVDINDEDGSTKEKYLSAVEKYPPNMICAEKVLASFIDSLLSGDQTVLETIENELSEREEALLGNDVEKDMNERLLKIKKQLSRRHTYYSQLLDIAESVCENDNGIFSDERLIYIDNMTKRISRLRDETAGLKNGVEHLQDAYSSYLDVKMNNTMKIFTVLTSIFFPLTIIVGWYGMNFKYMPELSWKYGYVYVIALSAVVVAVLAYIGKKKKWF